MNIDDRRLTNNRPTTDLGAYSHILGKFQMATTLQRVIPSTSRLVLGLCGVFGDDRWISAISGWIKSKMEASSYFEVQSAIPLKRILRFTSHMYTDHTLPFYIVYNDCWRMTGIWTLTSQQRLTIRPTV